MLLPSNGVRKAITNGVLMLHSSYGNLSNDHNSTIRHTIIPVISENSIATQLYTDAQQFHNTQQFSTSHSHTTISHIATQLHPTRSQLLSHNHFSATSTHFRATLLHNFTSHNCFPQYTTTLPHSHLPHCHTTATQPHYHTTTAAQLL